MQKQSGAKGKAKCRPLFVKPVAEIIDAQTGLTVGAISVKYGRAETWMVRRKDQRLSLAAAAADPSEDWFCAHLPKLKSSAMGGARIRLVGIYPAVAAPA